MAERDITAPMVAAVVRCGSPRPGIAPGTIDHTLCGITVVTGWDGAVITAFTRRQVKAKPNPKRLARLPGQTRRSYEREAKRSGARGW